MLRQAPSLPRVAQPASVRTRCSVSPLPHAQPSRRVLLAVLPPALLLAASARAAEPAEPVVANPLGEGQPVRPALPAAAYVKQLRQQRPAALAELRRLIDAGDFAGVSVALFIAPFDDVRQSAYFLVRASRNGSRGRFACADMPAISASAALGCGGNEREGWHSAGDQVHRAA